ncbi:MAG: LysR family transcriptional regulator [Pseudomonadales bacterium]
MRYSLRQLEVFLATAHHQSISQAAEQLAMSQSAASGALKELETRFNIQLFDRIGKRLQINEAGLALRPRAEELLQRAAEIENELLSQSQTGNIKVGATMTIGNYLAVPMVAEFMQIHPQSQVTLEVANTSEISRKVINFELDVGLIEGEINQAELDILPWAEDDLTVICAPGHPLSKLSKKSTATKVDDLLLSTPWIVREQGSGTRQAFERGMQGLLSKLEIAMELQHTEAIKRAVEANLGIACISRVAVAEAIERGSLAEVAVAHRNFHRQFYAITHKKKYLSLGIRQWLDFCLAKGNTF